MGLFGIDVSKWRPDLNAADFEKLSKAGFGFLGARHSYGLTPDATYYPYTDLARSFGWPVIAYHWVTPTDSLWDQSQLIMEMDEPDILALDVEETGVTKGHVRYLAAQVRRYFDCPLILYSRQNIVEKRELERELFDGTWFAHYGDDEPIWVAHLQDKQQEIDKRRDQEECDILQFTQKLKWRSPDGVESVDGNYFWGTQHQLTSLSG